MIKSPSSVVMVRFISYEKLPSIQFQRAHLHLRLLILPLFLLGEKEEIHLLVWDNDSYLLVDNPYILGYKLFDHYNLLSKEQTAATASTSSSTSTTDQHTAGSSSHLASYGSATLNFGSMFGNASDNTSGSSPNYKKARHQETTSSQQDETVGTSFYAVSITEDWLVL